MHAWATFDFALTSPGVKSTSPYDQRKEAYGKALTMNGREVFRFAVRAITEKVNHISSQICGANGEKTIIKLSSAAASKALFLCSDSLCFDISFTSSIIDEIAVLNWNRSGPGPSSTAT